MSDDPLPNSEIILYQTEDGRTRLEVPWLACHDRKSLMVIIHH